jgi:hypothetical protein
MDNRKAHLLTFRTANPDYRIKAWLSHNAECKSYRMTVVPVETRRLSDGTPMDYIKAFSGYTVFVEDAPRYSRKRLDALASTLKVLERACEMALSLGATEVI